jgi:hypothetical protein
MSGKIDTLGIPPLIGGQGHGFVARLVVSETQTEEEIGNDR